MRTVDRALCQIFPMLNFMLLKRKFGSSENLTFSKLYGIIYIENERRKEEEKPRLPLTQNFFKKIF
nr:MAG TPA: hypothetical protein [Caudoviricetes sp.]